MININALQYTLNIRLVERVVYAKKYTVTINISCTFLDTSLTSILGTTFIVTIFNFSILGTSLSDNITLIGWSHMHIQQSTAALDIQQQPTKQEHYTELHAPVSQPLQLFGRYYVRSNEKWGLSVRFPKQQEEAYEPTLLTLNAYPPPMVPNSTSTDALPISCMVIEAWYSK